MVESLIVTLIWIAVVVGCVFLVIWFLGQIGVALPARVVQIAWAIAVLVIILILWRSFGSALPGI